MVACCMTNANVTPNVVMKCPQQVIDYVQEMTESLWRRKRTICEETLETLRVSAVTNSVQED